MLRRNESNDIQDWHQDSKISSKSGVVLNSRGLEFAVLTSSAQNEVNGNET